MENAGGRRGSSRSEAETLPKLYQSEPRFPSFLGAKSVKQVNKGCARMTKTMSEAARKLLDEVLALPEDERLELASEIIASVDGPRDADWEASWLAELDRRVDRAKARGESGLDWTDARSQILKRLGRA